MDIDMEFLISLVENRPVLWDKSHDNYNDKHSTFAAWREIYNELIENYETLSYQEKKDFGKYVVKKWNNERYNWTKYHKKMKEYISGSEIQRKYKFYDQMLFLNKIVNHRPTESSIVFGNNITPSYTEDTNSQNSYGSGVSVITTISTETNKKRKKDREEEGNSRSMCFFRGIGSIVDKYSDDDYLEFQYEVTKIMRNLTERKRVKAFSPY